MMHSQSKKALAAMGIIISFLASNINAAGLSSWSETAADFQNGQRDNVDAGSDGLVLGDPAPVNNSWTRLSYGAPSSLTYEYPIMAYGQAHDALVFLADREGNPEFWIYDLKTERWEQRNLPNGNISRCSAMAYDSINGVVILYGYGMWTWTYDVGRDAWADMHPSSAPYARYPGSMVYDSAGRQIILFGASDNSSVRSNQTWIFNTTNKTWTNKKPVEAPAIYHHALAYDSRSELVVAFGRYGNDTAMSETWTYDPVANVWTNRSPSGSPTAREYHSMVYDPLTSEVLLFGGSLGNTYLCDTWSYNCTNNAWAQKSPGTNPSARANQTFVYDATRNRALVWGGVGSKPYNGPFWSYDPRLDCWMDLTNTDKPCCRDSHGLVYDAFNEKFILFGGVGDNVGYLNDTYSYDLGKKKWMKMNPDISPSPRLVFAMDYDAAEGKVVLYGGYYNNTYFCDTWAYDLVNDSWTNMKPEKFPQGLPGYSSYSMAYDSANEVMVLVDGYKKETWTYDLGTNTWTDMNPPMSPDGWRHAMAFDEATGEMVLISDSTWTYNYGENLWTDRKPKISPYWNTLGWGLIYDASSESIVRFGGFYFTMDPSPMNETWIYNSTCNNWTMLDVPNAPPPRGNHAIAYDGKDDAILVFGGAAGGHAPYYLGDLWTLDLPDKVNSGIYTSDPLDTGGESYFGELLWSGETPPNTSIAFQLRTDNSSDELQSKAFVGPDGTPKSFYAIPGQRINSVHNASRWVQYRAFLRSAEPPLSPILRNVTIDYNLIHSINILSPAGGAKWTGVQDIRWTSFDRDDDTVVFDMYLENKSSSILLAENLPEGTAWFSWDTDMTPDGIYRIRIRARDENPYIPLSVDAISSDFNINHTQIPNEPPTITLVSPPNNSVVNSAPVQFRWNGSDPDGDALSYILQIRKTPAIEPDSFFTSKESLDVRDLVDNRTYYWTVSVTDYRSEANPVISEMWSFTMQRPPSNRPVRIMSTPPMIAWTNQLYMYNITTMDEDNDLSAFNLLVGPPDMSLDRFTGHLRWTPNASDHGYHTITVQASDGRGSIANQTFTIQVLETPIPQIPPTCKITSPANGSKVGGSFQIRGTATIGRFSLTSILVRVDGSDWKLAAGFENWTLSMSTASLAEGRHRIEARAFDGTLYSETASVDLFVANPEPSVSSGWNLWYLPVVIIAFVAGIVVLLFLRRKGVGPP